MKKKTRTTVTHTQKKTATSGLKYWLKIRIDISLVTHSKHGIMFEMVMFMNIIMRNQ